MLSNIGMPSILTIYVLLVVMVNGLMVFLYGHLIFQLNS